MTAQTALRSEGTAVVNSSLAPGAPAAGGGSDAAAMAEVLVVMDLLQEGVKVSGSQLD